MRAAINNVFCKYLGVWLRLAGVISICSGLIGGYVWLGDLEDRADGDSLRWGSWHNPFMQFPPFNEPFLDFSMWVLLACSAAAGLGGILLLIPAKPGARLVSWQARVSIVFNGVIALFIFGAFFYYGRNATEEHFVGDSTYTALALRLGSIAVDLTLWKFLSNNAVREFFIRQSQQTQRGFDVITKEHS